MDDVTDARQHLILHLVGGSHLDGEIPLDSFARLAQHTQTLVQRVARALSGREGPGRTPETLQAATQLMLVGLRPGSTTLDIAGPPLQAELDLGDEIEPNVMVQTIQVLGTALEGVAHHDANLPDIAPSAVDTLSSWLVGLSSYDRVEVEVKESPHRPPRRVDFVPEAAHALLEQKRSSLEPHKTKQPSRVVEGELYAVNLHTGRFSLQDDLGHTIYLSVPTTLREGIERLLGQRAQATGLAVLDESGGIKELHVEELNSAPGVQGLDADAFWRVHELGSMLNQATPLASIDELAMDDLTDEEAERFWEAIDDRRG